MEALSPTLQDQARASYDRWTKARPELAKKHGLDDYVAFVQDQQRKRKQDAHPDDQVEQKASSTPGIAAADEGNRSRARHAHLTQILASRYPMPADLAAHVQHVRASHDDRIVTLDLIRGGRITDHGDHIEHHGDMDPATADAMIAAAAAKGWTRVNLTGSDEHKRAMAMACALRQPPITTDHTTTAAMRREITEKIRERAESAVPTPTPADLAAMDPMTRATANLDHAEAKAKAALSTRPTGSTDPTEIARPGLADLTERRRTAREDATEAREAADAHRNAHPWTTRLLDPASRRRQAALDADSRRMTTVADRMDNRHDREAQRIMREAKREATGNRQAAEDWTWSPATRRAQATVDQVERARQGMAAGDQDTIHAAAHGDVRNAARAASRQGMDAEAPDQAQAEAIRAAVNAVQEARDMHQVDDAMELEPASPALR